MMLCGCSGWLVCGLLTVVDVGWKLKLDSESKRVSRCDLMEEEEGRRVVGEVGEGKFMVLVKRTYAGSKNQLGA